MNIRTTLMLMAATVLPATAAPASTAELVQQLAAQEAAATTTEQAAKLYPALAQLPRSATDFLSINIGGFAALAEDALGASNAALNATGGGERSFPVEHLALGGQASDPAFYSALNDVMNALAQPAPAPEGGNGAPDPMEEATLNAALAELCGYSIAPTYLVMTCKSGQEAELEAVSQTPLMASLTPMETPPAGFQQAGRVDWEKALAGHEIDPATMAKLQQRPLCVMQSLKGNTLVMVICEKPEGISLPSSAANSVLATPAGKAAAAGASAEAGLLALHLSPKSLKTMQKSTWGGMLETVDALSGQPELAKSAGVLKRFLKGRADMPVKHPTTISMVKDAKGIATRIGMDAQGISYKPVPFRQASLGGAASTILYMESLPTVNSHKLPSFPQVLKAGMELFSASLAGAAAGGLDAADEEGVYGDGTVAVNHSTPAEDGEMDAGMDGEAIGPVAAGGISAAQAGMAMAPKFVGPLEKFTQAMEGNMALVVDGKGTLPEALGAKGKAACPRFGIYAGVEKRPLLSAAWDELMDAGALPPDLEIESKKAGKAMRYNIAHPLFNKDFMPNVLLLGKHAVFGTTPGLNVQMLKAAAKGQALPAGTVFIFRPKPLAGCLNSMAKAMPAEAGEEASLQQAAAAAENLAETIDSVYGMGMVEDGLYTMKVRVDFTEKK